MDIPIDLLVIIGDYLDVTLVLSKEQYRETIKRECSHKWYKKYKNAIVEIGLNHMVLSGKYNWKHQYLRVKNIDGGAYLKILKIKQDSICVIIG